MEETKEAEIIKPEGIILTPEQKKADLEARSKAFSAELKALCEKHKIDITCEIKCQPNGIFGVPTMIDLKK